MGTGAAAAVKPEKVLLFVPCEGNKKQSQLVSLYVSLEDRG
jgi:hypothetical protein